jgi:hypothetical protein
LEPIIWQTGGPRSVEVAQVIAMVMSKIEDTAAHTAGHGPRPATAREGAFSTDRQGCLVNGETAANESFFKVLGALPMVLELVKAAAGVCGDFFFRNSPGHAPVIAA